MVLVSLGQLRSCRSACFRSSPDPLLASGSASRASMRPTCTCTVTGRKLLAECQLFHATVVALGIAGRHNMPERGILASERFSSLLLSPVKGHGCQQVPMWTRHGMHATDIFEEGSCLGELVVFCGTCSSAPECALPSCRSAFVSKFRIQRATDLDASGRDAREQETGSCWSVVSKRSRSRMRPGRSLSWMMFAGPL